MMRTWLYLIAGICSALIGWNIGHFFLSDIKFLTQWPEISLFPCVSIALSVGMVMNEIFISSPTRPLLNLRKSWVPLLVATLIGVISGLIGGVFFQLFRSLFNEFWARLLGWLIVGASVGLAEGLTWQFYSMEAGDRRRFRQRLNTSVLGSCIASFIAASLFEIIRQSQQVSELFRKAEDPLGFAILGLLLGLTFSLTSSPSYLVALRAGKGFEYKASIDPGIDPFFKVQNSPTPTIHNNLKFVSESYTDQTIEEGLSIELPATGTIKIGSAPRTVSSDGIERGSDIYIPGLPSHIADINITYRDVIIEPNPRFYKHIEINGTRLSSRQKVRLKHNYLIAFHVEDPNADKPNEPQIYRFVFYNRFLDPQA